MGGGLRPSLYVCQNLRNSALISPSPARLADLGVGTMQLSCWWYCSLAGGGGGAQAQPNGVRIFKCSHDLSSSSFAGGAHISAELITTGCLIRKQVG